MIWIFDWDQFKLKSFNHKTFDNYKIYLNVICIKIWMIADQDSFFNKSVHSLNCNRIVKIIKVD